MLKLFRMQLVVLLCSVTIFATYALAFSGKNPAFQGGESEATISGWNISNVHYRLAEDVSKIGAVELDLDGPADQVVIGFGTASDRTFSCYNTSGHHWLCQVDGIDVARINTVRVIAVS